MLPDGREPGPGIDPHQALIVVDSDAVTAVSGWPDGARDTGRFELPPCEVILEGADVEGTLDTSRQEPFLPHLGRINREFRIDPERAETIATIPIRRGVMEAHRVPRSRAVMSQLEVPHDGAIRITVKPRDGSPVRSITVAAESEIAVLNTAETYGGADEHNGHFRIYEKLGAQRVLLAEPEDVAATLQESVSECVVFTTAMSAGLTASCSNTGCCP
jgi:hypothetical protein